MSSSYLLLFWAPRDVLSRPRSAEEARASGDRWRLWAETLQDAGHLVGGAQLDGGGRYIRGPEKLVAEGAFGEGHVVGGYFLITASSLEQATELAKGCPILPSGGTVEVRPLLHT